MLKRISFILVLIVVTVLLSVSVFAAPGDKADNKEVTEKVTDKTTDKDADKTTEKEIEKSKPLITISRRNIDGENVFSNIYTIRGYTERNNISIQLFKKNSDGTYSEFKGNDEKSEWKINDESGNFSIEITLSGGYKNTPSLNCFMIKAFDRTDPDNIESYKFSVTFIEAKNKLKSDPTDLDLKNILKPTK